MSRPTKPWREIFIRTIPTPRRMLNANAWTNADEYYDHANRPPLAMPDDEIHGLHALYRLYRCREGWGFLGCLFQDE